MPGESEGDEAPVEADRFRRVHSGALRRCCLVVAALLITMKAQNLMVTKEKPRGGSW